MLKIEGLPFGATVPPRSILEAKIYKKSKPEFGSKKVARIHLRGVGRRQWRAQEKSKTLYLDLYLDPKLDQFDARPNATLCRKQHAADLMATATFTDPQSI